MKCRPALVTALVAASLLVASSPLHESEAEPRPPVIVAFGDSLTAGLGLKQSEAFPAQLEAALKARGHDVTVVDAGVSGDTASAGLARLDWALPDEASAVIIELGANDALQGLPPGGTKEALAKIIEKVQAKGLKVLLAGMEAPRNLGDDYVQAYTAMYRDLATTYDAILYPFFLDGVALNPELMQADGIHPNAKGVAVIVKNMLAKVEELLSQVKTKG